MHGKLTFGKAVMTALISIPVLGALTACGARIVYDVAPPRTPEGRACAARCQSSAKICQQMQQNAVQQCRSNYALILQNYNACRESGSNACVMPPSCTSRSGADCSRSFRECFAACGGSVTARVIEKR